jgi:poly(3-hydroxybutyrate) depolymerase
MLAPTMLRVLLACVSVAAAMNASNTPTCSVNGAAGGQVVTFSDGTYQRCMSLITPSSAAKPMPILWWFHGSGGNAAHCGNQQDLIDLAESVGFAFICGEATQNVFGHGGQWNIPAKITDETGTPCGTSDSVEVNYMKSALAYLEKSPETYDTTRVFTSGCSMGSAFSGYIGNCLKQWEPQQISAFATHSTGLKVKGDGNHLPDDWGECDGCQYWPFAPVKYTDKLGLKACVFDNTGDGDFYKTSEYLAQEWPKLSNPTESHFASGGHCQNIPYSDIVKCLGISSSSPMRFSSAMSFPPPAGSMAVSSSSYELGGFLCGKQEPTCNIYYPTELDKGPFPIATFGHGMGGQIIDDLVESVASLGFVVVAPATSGGKCDDNHYKDMLHALEGSKAKPSLHEALAHVDWNRSAIFGHSMGGFATILAAAEAMKDPAKYNVKAIVASHGYIGDATKEAATITIPAMFTTGTEDHRGAVKGQFDATPGRPKVLAEVEGAVHMEPAINGRLNPFDAHFLGCHVAGLQTSCDKVYGGGADDMCQANTMTLCQIEKDELLMV